MLQQISSWNLERVYVELKKENVTIDKKYKYIHPKKTDNKEYLLSLGRIWFNCLLPDDWQLYDEPITKKKMTGISTDLLPKYGPEKTCEIIELITKESFKLASINPKSFKISAFIFPPDWLERKKEFMKNADNLDDINFIKEAKKLTEELVSELEKQNIGIQDIINSGSKGGIADWQALLVSRGLVVDVMGKISRIKESNNDGYTVESYYKGGSQARRNYYFKSTLTAEPGYLARKVTTASANVTLSTVEDCGTERFLEIYVKNINLLIGRYYKSGSKLKLINKKDKDIQDKIIKLRSPIYCTCPDGICKTCYGKSSGVLNIKNIGIVAGGVINNVAVNSLMKMRHKASQVEIQEINFIEILKKTNIDHKLFAKILKIDVNKIYAKLPIQIILNLNDYDDRSLIEFSDKYNLPGTFDIQYLDDENITKEISLPFNFSLNLIKPIGENINISKKTIILKYQPGDLIMQQDKLIGEVDMKYINRLFDGGVKYIKTPEMFLDSISNIFTIDLVHHETIISNLFRQKEDNSILGRHCNYVNCELIGCKKLGITQSWLNGIAFENMNRVISQAVLHQKDAVENPIENILMEKY